MEVSMITSRLIDSEGLVNITEYMQSGSVLCYEVRDLNKMEFRRTKCLDEANQWMKEALDA